MPAKKIDDIGPSSDGEESGHSLSQESASGDRLPGKGPIARAPRLAHSIALRLFSFLPPRVYGYLRRGRVGTAARKVLDVLMPKGDRALTTVRAGRLSGATMVLDPRKQKEMIIGSYEAEVQEALCRNAGEGDVVFDIGAHLGFFTLLASRVVGPNGRVIAVEPDPFMAERLHTNLDLNRTVNVDVLGAAVGANKAQRRFSPGEGGGTGHLSDEGSLNVDVASLDELAASHGAPRLIKVDVEGGELEVLQGAEKVLDGHHPILILEMHDEDNERRAASMLASFGYEMSFLTDVSGRRHLLATPGV